MKQSHHDSLRAATVPLSLLRSQQKAYNGNHFQVFFLRPNPKKISKPVFYKMNSVDYSGTIHIISGTKDKDIFHYAPLENDEHLNIDPTHSGLCIIP